MTTTPVIGYFDGLCEQAYRGGPRNPGGIACGGWYVPPCPSVPGLEQGLEGGTSFVQGAGATNNVGEYRAALACVRAIADVGWHGPTELRGDSQLVVHHYSGAWGCKAPLLVPLLVELRAQGRHFTRLTLVWVPREENMRADALSRQAYWDALASVRSRP